ncbi:helix-turn-helix transcriptional regulator [Desulfobacter latus]|uniref:Helix-turn-helix transcriptional regulator n=2 Tax=Desulfobacter latus TaxID=2292 RepID=A0A850SZP8_9BACT|nr:helix-turn-helix transcriptional regulator [Desulfobacter latus]
MLGHTKKPPIELRFIGPPENREKAINALQALGFADVSGLIPAGELFEDFKEDSLPGLALLGARTKEGVTQKQLSELTGISQAHISEMENHKRTIGKKRARILGKALKISYKVFL